jgi:hypothetical protein
MQLCGAPIKIISSVCLLIQMRMGMKKLILMKFGIGKFYEHVLGHFSIHFGWLLFFSLFHYIKTPSLSSFPSPHFRDLGTKTMKVINRK